MIMYMYDAMIMYDNVQYEGMIMYRYDGMIMYVYDNVLLLYFTSEHTTSLNNMTFAFAQTLCCVIAYMAYREKLILNNFSS